ncbi:magnesium and cobalt transport protein CorA [Nonomuraea sp. NPDC050328]|uniref:magnesium and cobalt transport protein CorA n=1 Tax=Nonomuraea sp. NPDC050328 TaxID=3364361 RepID=UPI0037A26C31
MSVRSWLCTGDGLSELDRAPGDLPGVLAGLTGSAYLWVELGDPSAEELRTLGEHLGLPGIVLQDAGHHHQRPKSDTVQDLRVWVLKTLWYLEPTSQIETGDLAVVLGRNLLVTVRHGRGDPVPQARARLTGGGKLLGRGPLGAVYALVSVLVDDYLSAAAEVAKDVTELERDLFAGPRIDAVKPLYSLRREILEFRDAIAPMEPVADDFLDQRSPDAYLRELARHVRRAAQSVRSSEELIGSLLNAHLGQISMWQNEDMRKISGWAAIIAAPTLLAGIYGMNFDDMPELHWRFGYPAVLLVMALTCWLLYRAFRRNGWL